MASNGTQPNDASDIPSASADGRYVAFHSFASNLVQGDTNATSDIFVHDRQTGQTTRVSVSSDGTQGNGKSETARINADGRYISFTSFASNLVPGDTNNAFDVFVCDRVASQSTRVSVATDGTQANGDASVSSISGDGRCVAFMSAASNLVSGDSNDATDIFVHERSTLPLKKADLIGTWADTGVFSRNSDTFPEQVVDNSAPA